MPERALVVGVDPASTSGYGVLIDGRPYRWGTLATPDPAAAAAGIAAVFERVERHGPPGVVAIEEHTNPKLATLAARRLHEARTAWETVAVLRGWAVERITAQRWQGAWLGRLPSAQRKARARVLAAATAKVDPARIGSDAADALCIALYWWQTIRPMRAAEARTACSLCHVRRHRGR